MRLSITHDTNSICWRRPGCASPVPRLRPEESALHGSIGVGPAGACASCCVNPCRCHPARPEFWTNRGVGPDRRPRPGQIDGGAWCGARSPVAAVAPAAAPCPPAPMPRCAPRRTRCCRKDRAAPFDLMQRGCIEHIPLPAGKAHSRRQHRYRGLLAQCAGVCQTSAPCFLACTRSQGVLGAMSPPLAPRITRTGQPAPGAELWLATAGTARRDHRRSAVR